MGHAMSDPTKVSRRLVAVFAADAEGYSRLMGADEVGGRAPLSSHFEIGVAGRFRTVGPTKKGPVGKPPYLAC